MHAATVTQLPACVGTCLSAQCSAALPALRTVVLGCAVPMVSGQSWQSRTPTSSCAVVGRCVQPLIQPGVQLVVANFPHNPTGTTLQQQDWQQLVKACEAAGAWLFSDEMYRFTGGLQPQCSACIPSKRHKSLCGCACLTKLHSTLRQRTQCWLQVLD